MPAALFAPEISAAFTVAPEVVYSPIVPEPLLATNRSEPDTAMKGHRRLYELRQEWRRIAGGVESVLAGA